MSTIRDNAAPTVHLERDLCFYYSDLFPGNFIITDAGDLCLVDFDQAGFLPVSFMSYALTQSHWSSWLMAEVQKIMMLPEHNLDAMKSVAYYFAIGARSIGESGRASSSSFAKLMSQVTNIKFDMMKGLPSRKKR